MKGDGVPEGKQPLQSSLHEEPTDQPSDRAERQLVLDRVFEDRGLRTLWNHPVHVLPVTKRTRQLQVRERTATLVVLMFQIPPQREGAGLQATEKMRAEQALRPVRR